MEGSESRTALDWPRDVGVSEEVLAEMTRLVARRRRVRFAIGAIGITAGLAVLALFSYQRYHPQSATFQISTPTRNDLSDGSVVVLDTGATVKAEFTPAVRRVKLESGQALFHVAKNVARPFIVEAGGVTVQAVGTIFAVDVRAKSVEVVVTQGKVLVGSDYAGTATRTPVSAGYHLIVDSSGKGLSAKAGAEAIDGSQIQDRLAWLIPKLEFANTPLPQAIELCNEYGRARLVIGDPTVSKIHISGMMRADNVAALTRLLQSDFGVSAETDARGEIILRKAR